MISHEQIRDFLNRNDAFCRVNHIRITEIGEDSATGELTITPEILNSNGVVQGGAIFTLMDFTFAGAANSGNDSMVSMQLSVNFIRPGTGSKLTAFASKISRGKKTGVYFVKTLDENGNIVATATATGHALGHPLLEE